MLEANEDRGQRVKALENRPKLPSYLEWYVISFYSLSSQRGQGMNGPLPISYQDLVAYLKLYPWFDKDSFINHICIQDRAYLKYEYEKIEQKSNARKK